MAKQKVTPVQFVKQHAEILKKIDDFKKKINKEVYTPLYKQFIKDNCPYKVGKVYELEKNGIRRRGFTRFVIYGFDACVMFERIAMIDAGGWWLDENSNPTKWDSFNVFGAGNAAIFKLSENQTNNPKAK